MKTIGLLLASSSAGGLFYLFGVLIIHPYSPLVYVLEKNGIIYDKILKVGHFLCLCLWLATASFFFCTYR